MKTELIYVEKIEGHSGPAWIGYGQYNRSGKTVYFNGKVFGRSQRIIGNHVDIELGYEYWISGVKKNGADRHWAGSGKIYIDTSVISDYLKIIGTDTLPKNKFILTDLDNIPNKDLARRLENIKMTGPVFNKELLYKKTPKDLNNEELGQVINYYEDLDLKDYPIKSRKDYTEKLNALLNETQDRKNNSAY